MGADDADSKKHGYGLVECYGRLPTTTRLLLPPDLLKGQTRLLLNKLPDTMPEKRAVGGWGSPVCGRFPPLWCFPPRGLGAAPLWFLCRA